jgi:diacylglycerol kinase family enzyme
MKAIFGSNAYSAQAVFQLFKNNTETFDIDVENGQHVYKDVTTNMLMVYNSRLGGGNMVINPFGIINDGMAEVLFTQKPLTILENKAFKEGAIAGGLQAYDDHIHVVRAKTLKVTSKNKNRDGTPKTLNFNIDGEDLTFKDFVQYEVMHNHIQFIGNYQEILESQYF